MSEQGRSIGGIYVPPGFKARGYCLFFPSLEMPIEATTQKNLKRNLYRNPNRNIFSRATFLCLLVLRIPKLFYILVFRNREDNDKTTVLWRHFFSPRK